MQLSTQRGLGRSRGQEILGQLRTDNQKEAVAIAREIARNQQSECFTHGRNGRIRARDSYGNDPYPSKG